MTKRAVIFDLDGVIADTFLIHIQGWKHIGALVGADKPLASYEDFKGVPTIKAISKLMDRLQVQIGNQELNNLVLEKNIVRDKSLSKLTPKDLDHRASRILDLVKSKGDILQKLEIVELFDEIYFGEKVKVTKLDEVKNFISSVTAKFQVLPENIYCLDDSEQICLEFDECGANGFWFPNCIDDFLALYN